MPWKISGQIGPHTEPGYDGTGWLWELEQDGYEARRVFVQIAGSAWAVYQAGGGGLASETRKAIESEGQSEVEAVLNEAEPPRMIGCSTYGCNPLTG